MLEAEDRIVSVALLSSALSSVFLIYLFVSGSLILRPF